MDLEGEIAQQMAAADDTLQCSERPMREGALDARGLRGSEDKGVNGVGVEGDGREEREGEVVPEASHLGNIEAGFRDEQQHRDGEHRAHALHTQLHQLSLERVDERCLIEGGSGDLFGVMELLEAAALLVGRAHGQVEDAIEQADKSCWACVRERESQELRRRQPDHTKRLEALHALRDASNLNLKASRACRGANDLVTRCAPLGQRTWHIGQQDANERCIGLVGLKSYGA